MFETISSSKFRPVALAATAITVLALLAGSASAATVKLRVEGLTTTHFSGTVTTNAQSVQGAPDRPACRSNETPATFTAANSITAAADALGAANVTTSGTHYGWGTLLCSVAGEFPADLNAGWLVRINQQDSTAPGGYVSATNPLSNGDSVVLFMSPAWGHFTESLELLLPAEVKTGQVVSGHVDSYSTGTDVKSPGAAVAVSGGGATATSAADGNVQLTFPAAGKFLVRAEKSGAVRGSQWVTVTDAAPTAPPVTPPTQAQVDKQRRVAARANCRAQAALSSSFDRAQCIRNANRLGRTPTAKQRRISAREKCVRTYPSRTSRSRIRCVRAANRIGR